MLVILLCLLSSGLVLYVSVAFDDSHMNCAGNSKEQYTVSKDSVLRYFTG